MGKCVKLIFRLKNSCQNTSRERERAANQNIIGDLWRTENDRFSLRTEMKIFEGEGRRVESERDE